MQAAPILCILITSTWCRHFALGRSWFYGNVMLIRQHFNKLMTQNPTRMCNHDITCMSTHWLDIWRDSSKSDLIDRKVYLNFWQRRDIALRCTRSMFTPHCYTLLACNNTGCQMQLMLYIPSSIEFNTDMYRVNWVVRIRKDLGWFCLWGSLTTQQKKTSNSSSNILYERYQYSHKDYFSTLLHIFSICYN